MKNVKNKLCLGTVQLGMTYGVKNELGRQPTQEESFAVLDTAVDSGVDVFDTAAAYGEAESLLASYGLAKRGVRIITKLPAGVPDEKDAVFSACKKSLESIGTDKLDGYLLHEAKDIYRKGIMEGLAEVKKQGLVSHVGVSIYEPEDALAAADNDIIDYIQVPYNVLDQRLDECDFFKKAKGRGMTVFARSAFLQGLLLMDPLKLPRGLQSAQPYIRGFGQIAEQYGFSRLEAAFLYSYTHPGIDYVVFGVDTKEQLQDNLKLVGKANSFGECFKKLHGAFRDVPREIIVPSLWNK